MFGRGSAGSPAGVAGEQAIGKSGLIANEEPKAQTEQAGCRHKATIQPGESGASKGKWQGERRGDQHHARDRAGAENQ